jgi:RNase adaptor protein for sRNA GlmZ degradation
MLRIRIFSFSYLRSGIPEDETTNGGGFVFDCRFIENPGRHAELMPFTGKDEPVIQLLENNKEMKAFLKNVFEVIDLTIKKYTARGFTDLMISFGCTGGQHRSVYSAEKLRGHIERNFKDVNVTVKHVDLS